jgi:hypothetical protein
MTHLVGLPDTISSALVDAAEINPATRYVQVTREGEAFALAAGLWVGGAEPVVVVQNTGLLESGDSLRGTAVRMGIPVLCLVTYRGHRKMAEAGLGPAFDPPDRATLVRPDVDSTPLLTEPTLRTWGIPNLIMSSDGDVGAVIDLWSRARTESRPVVALLRERLA